MRLVERSKFGLNELLGLRPCGPVIYQQILQLQKRQLLPLSKAISSERGKSLRLLEQLEHSSDTQHVML